MAQAVVRSACTKLRSAIGDEATKRLNFTDDLQGMLEQLVAIHVMIPNAENLWRVTNDTDQGKILLPRVEAAAYMVGHLMEELQEMTGPAAGEKMAKMLVRPEKEISGKMKKMKGKLMKLHKELQEEVQKEWVQYSDDDLQAPEASAGREEDAEKIVAQLSACDSREGPIILPILGEVGVGKATVAAMVYEDARFKCYFRMWINRSHALRTYPEIGKYIISQLASAVDEPMNGHSFGVYDYEEVVYIKNRLHEVLNGKKVLIVLHDLKGDHRSISMELKDMLSVGGMGSTQVIVIATIDASEDSEQDSTVDKENFGVQPYWVRPPSEETCCKIIKQAAGKSADKQDLERIAPQLAKLCEGRPLVAQLFGSVLKFKQYAEWPEIKDLGSFLSGPLQLSYTSMHPNLRLCVAYCAFVLETEREILKEDLINQWIALDLIEPSEVFSAPQLAEQYLSTLLDMSILQTTKSSWTSAKDDTSTITFIIHKMTRELMQDIISSSLGKVHKGRTEYSSQHYSYVSLLYDYDDGPWKTQYADKMRALRCLHCRELKHGDDFFLFPRHLRVLELHESSVQKLPDSICQLRHLGYLKLSSWSGLVTLPDSIGDLINLVHIDLSDCYKLKDLTGSFGKLINLLYISLSGCSKLKNLPDSFGNLIKVVNINLSGCSGLENLPESFTKLIKLVHINLSGCLALVNLPASFGKLTKLEHANLSDCTKLANLPGSFGKLTNLVHINLSGCCGLRKLPGSFGELTSLVHIDLSGCYGLEQLPESFGGLTSLAHVDLSGCYGLKELPQTFGKLISLAHISLSGCSGLATLPGSFGNLQNLLYVDLARCYGLSKLPESFGKLKQMVHLDLSFWSRFEVIQTALDGLTNLQDLNLSNPCCLHAEYPRLEGLKQFLGQLISLKHLNLSMFLNPIFCNQSEKKNLKYLELIGSFSRLKYLNLSNSIFLCDLPENLKGLRNLHTLDLSGCIRLKNVPECVSKMSSLKSLVLSNMETYQFEVGKEDVTNNYGQLVDVRCKELDLTCLEKMKSVEEPRGTRLAEKHTLQKLKLSWSMGSKGTLGDNAILEELVPANSLQHLELHGYSSTCFPSWLTLSISSLNLVEVIMEDIPNCSHLPPLGLLPNLQQLVLRRMNSITRINAGESSGGNKKAFNRLSKFTIDDMGSLEIFTYYSGGGGSGGEKEFRLPVIDELVVRKCPNLSFVPLPPRAQKLVISDCNDVMICWGNRVGRDGVEVPCCISCTAGEVTELVVENCRVYLSHWCLLKHLPGLRSLTIKNCNNLICSAEIVGILSSLERLCFSECHMMMTLPEHLGGLSFLQELQIKSCDSFRKLPESMEHLTSLEKLVIEGCVSICSLPASISKLTNLKDLHILGCQSLKWWCEEGEGRKILGHILPKFDRESPTSEQGQQLEQIEEDDLEQWGSESD